MNKVLERIVVSIYHFFAELRIKWVVRRYGYRVTNLEWLPEDVGDERIVRITPNEDFPHQGDDCPCEPVRTQEDIGDGEYTLIQHREMDVNDQHA